MASKKQSQAIHNAAQMRFKVQAPDLRGVKINKLAVHTMLASRQDVTYGQAKTARDEFKLDNTAQGFQWVTQMRTYEPNEQMELIEWLQNRAAGYPPVFYLPEN
jgi:hypothetical protein